MNTLLCSLLVTLLLHNADPEGPIKKTGKRDHPTKLAHFRVGAHLSADCQKLRLNIDKELGGFVSIQLVNQQGILCYEKTLRPDEGFIRMNMDLSQLSDNNYTLTISNGLDEITRELHIRPVTQLHSITLE